MTSLSLSLSLFRILYQVDSLSLPLLVSYHFAFHTVHGVFKARILKWLAIPFSSGPHSVRLLHHDPPWVALQAWLGFIELVKAVVLM